MTFTAGLTILVLLAVVVSDVWLARRIRSAIDTRHLPLPGFENYRFGGSPIGIAYNVAKLRKLPEVTELSDPDLIAIRRHARIHQLSLVVLAASLVALLLLQFVVGPAT